MRQRQKTVRPRASSKSGKSLNVFTTRFTLNLSDTNSSLEQSLSPPYICIKEEGPREITCLGPNLMRYPHIALAGVWLIWLSIVLPV